MIQAKEQIEFFDPHFHIWDFSENGPHDKTFIGANKINGSDTFTIEDYFEVTKNERIKIVGGVFVEAMSACYENMIPIQHNQKCIEEYKYALSKLSTYEDFYLCPAANLEQVDDGTLQIISKHPKTKGIRQILNYQPNWPRVKENLLNNDKWKSGYVELSKTGLTFDLQLNPHQYEQAVDIISQNPSLHVVIDHLGTPFIEDLQNKESTYWQNMYKFSKMPNVFIKISQLWYISKNWHNDQIIIQSAREIIDLFGVDKCMFATNYPVDLAQGGDDISKMISGFLKICEGQSNENINKLFKQTAKIFYKI